MRGVLLGLRIVLLANAVELSVFGLSGRGLSAEGAEGSGVRVEGLGAWDLAGEAFGLRVEAAQGLRAEGLRAEDAGADVWYFISHDFLAAADTSFLSGKVEFELGHLQYDSLGAEPLSSSAPMPDIVLRCPKDIPPALLAGHPGAQASSPSAMKGLTIGFADVINPWEKHRYSIPLADKVGWMNLRTGLNATSSELSAVLSCGASTLVRGGHFAGAEVTVLSALRLLKHKGDLRGLDLKVSAVPTSAASQPGSTGTTAQATGSPQQNDPQPSQSQSTESQHSQLQGNAMGPDSAVAGPCFSIAGFTVFVTGRGGVLGTTENQLVWATAASVRVVPFNSILTWRVAHRHLFVTVRDEPQLLLFEDDFAQMGSVISKLAERVEEQSRLSNSDVNLPPVVRAKADQAHNPSDPRGFLRQGEICFVSADSEGASTWTLLKDLRERGILAPSTPPPSVPVHEETRQRLVHHHGRAGELQTRLQEAVNEELRAAVSGEEAALGLGSERFYFMGVHSMQSILLSDISSIGGDGKRVHLLGKPESAGYSNRPILLDLDSRGFHHEELHIFLTKLAKPAIDNFPAMSPPIDERIDSSTTHSSGPSRKLSSAESLGESSNSDSWARISDSVMERTRRFGIDPAVQSLQASAMSQDQKSALMLTDSGLVIFVMPAIDVVSMPVSEINGLNLVDDGALIHVEAGTSQVTVQINLFEPGPLRVVFKTVKQLMKSSPRGAKVKPTTRIDFSWLDEQTLPPFMRTPLNVPQSGVSVHEQLHTRYLLRKHLQSAAASVLVQACSLDHILAVSEKQVILVDEKGFKSVNISDITRIDEQDQGDTFRIYGTVSRLPSDDHLLLEVTAEGFNKFQVRVLFQQVVSQAKDVFSRDISGPMSPQITFKGEDEVDSATPGEERFRSLDNDSGSDSIDVDASHANLRRKHTEATDFFSDRVEWLREVARQEHHGFTGEAAAVAGLDSALVLTLDGKLLYAESGISQTDDSAPVLESRLTGFFRVWRSGVLFVSLPVTALADIGAAIGSSELAFVVHKSVAFRLPLKNFNTKELSSFMSNLKEWLKKETKSKRIDMIPALKTNELFAVLRREELSSMFEKENEERQVRNKWRRWQKAMNLGMPPSTQILVQIAGKSCMVAVTNQNEILSVGDDTDLKRVNLNGVQLSQGTGDITLYDDSMSPVFHIQQADFGPHELGLLLPVLQQKITTVARIEAKSAGTRQKAGDSATGQSEGMTEGVAVQVVSRDHFAAVIEQAVRENGQRLEAIAIGATTAIGISSKVIHHVTIKPGSYSDLQHDRYDLREVGDVKETSGTMLEIHRHVPEALTLWRHRSGVDATHMNAGILLALDVGDFQRAELQQFFQYLDHYASLEKAAADKERKALDAQKQIVQEMENQQDDSLASAHAELLAAADVASIDQGASLLEVESGGTHLVLCKESMIVSVEKADSGFKIQTVAVKQISTLKNLENGALAFMDKGGTQLLKIDSWSFNTQKFSRFMARLSQYLKSIHSFDALGRHPQAFRE